MKKLLALLSITAVLLTTAACSDPMALAHAPVSRTATTPQQGAATVPASVALATLPVKGRAPTTGYDRVAKFGEAWSDATSAPWSRNGLDTRNDILSRDLSGVTCKTAVPKAAPHCVVARGTLLDPYTGTTIDFVRGPNTSSAVQIDHVVALSNSWQTGAQQLTPEQREALANDPLNLLAVDGPANQQKSDGDAATWLPANKSFRCNYVARQVAVKKKYSLWLTRPEHDAIAGVLTSCPGQLLPSDAEARLHITR